MYNSSTSPLILKRNDRNQDSTALYYMYRLNTLMNDILEQHMVYQHISTVSVV